MGFREGAEAEEWLLRSGKVFVVALSLVTFDGQLWVWYKFTLEWERAEKGHEKADIVVP